MDDLSRFLPVSHASLCVCVPIECRESDLSINHAAKMGSLSCRH